MRIIWELQLRNEALWNNNTNKVPQWNLVHRHINWIHCECLHQACFGTLVRSWMLKPEFHELLTQMSITDYCFLGYSIYIVLPSWPLTPRILNMITYIMNVWDSKSPYNAFLVAHGWSSQYSEEVEAICSSEMFFMMGCSPNHSSITIANDLLGYFFQFQLTKMRYRGLKALR